jgi:hypothetical protein
LITRSSDSIQTANGCINAARYLDSLAQAERAKPEPQLDLVVKYVVAAAKIAHDVSPWLYPTLQSIKLGGDEDAAPIRMENLSVSSPWTAISLARNGSPGGTRTTKGANDFAKHASPGRAPAD